FVPFDNEVYQLALDGSRKVRRLFHHRSRPIGGSYFYESRASESRSGRYVVFASNFGKSQTGSPDYTDVYLAPLPVAESPGAPLHVVPPPYEPPPVSWPGLPPSGAGAPGPEGAPRLLARDEARALREGRQAGAAPWLVRARTGCAAAGAPGGVAGLL